MLYKIFIRFLKRENIFDNYKMYIKPEISSIRQINPRQLIARTMYWDETMEGHDYWCKLHFKWMSILIYIGKKYNTIC
jgi:hypothetical protein